MKAQGRPEAAIAAHVVSWLEADGWDVYQEVVGADIVAVRGPVLWALECKVVLGFSVLSQAMGWRSSAHGVWVATPYRRKDRAVVKSFCSYAGIGWLEVSKHGSVRVLVRPEFNRRADDYLRKSLRPGQKTYAAAGSPDGRSWTPYKDTCRQLLSIVAARPGVPLSDAVRAVKHHYSNDSSARRTLVSRIMDKAVPGVRMERRSGAVLLFPSG